VTLMRRTYPLVALAFLCGLTLGLSKAHAETAVVVVSGKAQTKDRAIVASAVRSAARSEGWQLVEAPLAESEVTTIVACLKGPKRWSCVSPVLAGKDIQRLIVVSLDPEDDGSGALVLTEHVLLPGSDVASSNQHSCAKCIEERLARVAFDVTKQLLEEATAGTGRTKLRVLSTPSAAWITLDATNVGLTDNTISTFPGRHVVTVQRDGYLVETRTIDVTENQENTVAFTLRANRESSKTAPSPAGHPHLIPGLIIGVGAAAIVTGIVLQLPPDAGPGIGSEPKYLVNAPGAISVIGGGLAVGLGIYLWVRATNNAAPLSMPTAAPMPGGGVVGWMGHF
jgi:PEGA domain